MSRRAYTLIEILAVLGVISVLAALGFTLSAPARESSRQSACTSQLKSIFQALALYANDYDNGANYPELHGLAYVNTRSGSGNYNKADVLKSYGFVPEFNFCPSSSIRMREALASSYMWPICIEPVDDLGKMSRSRERVIEDERRLGSALPIVECHIHDELFYAPSEQHIAPRMASPFRILLRVDGSVKRGRAAPPRTSIFTDLTYATK